MFADFRRAKLMFAAIAAAMAAPDLVTRQAKLGAIGPYRSRGHGRGLTTYANGRGSRGGNNAGMGVPHQGRQECLRRLRGGWAGYSGGVLTKRRAVEILDSGVMTFAELAGRREP
jgi:hypothetical protein